MESRGERRRRREEMRISLNFDFSQPPPNLVLLKLAMLKTVLTSSGPLRYAEKKPQLMTFTHFGRELPPPRSPFDIRFAAQKRWSSWFSLGAYLLTSSDPFSLSVTCHVLQLR